MMKTRKLIILGMVIVACMMTSCKKDEETPTNSVVFKASIESRREMGIDKTAIDTTDPQNRGKVVWSVGDRIRIHNGAAQNNNHMFTLTSQPGLVHGDFCFNGEYELTGNYLAAYPTTGEINFSENKVVFSLPAIQNLGTTDGTFVNGANPMVAKATDINGLQFKNACGGIGIRLRGASEGVTVSNIRITSYRTNDCLWGNLTVYMNNDGTIDNMSLSNGETSRNIIDLSCNIELSTTETKRVFIILPEGTLSQGFTLDVTYKENGGENQTFTKTTTSDVATVVRNTLKSLPKLTIGS